MSASHTSYEIQHKHSGAVVCFAAFIKLASLSSLPMILPIMYYVAKEIIGFMLAFVMKNSKNMCCGDMRKLSSY